MIDQQLRTIASRLPIVDATGLAEINSRQGALLELGKVVAFFRTAGKRQHRKTRDASLRAVGGNRDTGPLSP